MDENFFDSIVRALCETLSNLYAGITGLFISVLGYFLPVKNIMHLLFLFFILDVVFGYCAANKLRGERFSVKVIWTHTIPRMLVSIVLILGAYMWDSVYQQEVFSTYKLIGWFITGVLLYSIAENGYYLTKWRIFKKIGEVITERVIEKTEIENDKDTFQKSINQN